MIVPFETACVGQVVAALLLGPGERPHEIPPAGLKHPDPAVFRSGGPDYDTFRIPALIEASNGDLLALSASRAASSSV